MLLLLILLSLPTSSSFESKKPIPYIPAVPLQQSLPGRGVASPNVLNQSLRPQYMLLLLLILLFPSFESKEPIPYIPAVPVLGTSLTSMVSYTQTYICAYVHM
jgi:hypothetical protein